MSPLRRGAFLRRCCALVGATLLCAPLTPAYAASRGETSRIAGTAGTPADPFPDAVDSVTPGTNGGFGSNLLPDIVLGPPRGGGLLQGSFDVLALGIGGAIVLRFDQPVICDGPGPDFTVFENAFHSGSEAGPLFAEYGFVAVSQDGEHFFEMPYDAMSGQGLAGRTPVLSNPENGISPLDPAVSGGDAFDLAAAGLTWAAYVRITDVAGTIHDPGDLPQFTIAPNAGFDLDAVAAVHACDPSAADTPTPSATPTATLVGPTATPTIPASTSTATPAAPSATPTQPAPTATLTPESTPSAPLPTESPTPLPPSATPTLAEATATPSSAPPTPAATPLPGDLDGDGHVTAADVSRLVGELYDVNDPDPVDAQADVNADGVISAADIVALTVRRTE